MSDERRPDFDADEIRFLNEFSAGRTPPLQCPSPARLQAFSAGALPEEQRQAIERHLSGCSACRLLVQELAQWGAPPPGKREVRALRHRIASRAPELRRKRTRWYWAWLAAPAAAAAAVVLVLSLVRPPAIPGPQPPRLTSVTGFPAVEKAPVRLPASALLLWRGAGESAAPAEMRELVAALMPYQKDDYREAARLLAPLAGRYPRSFEAAFYLGVSLLMLERPAEATAPLERARALGDARQREEASRYLSLAMVRARPALAPRSR
jgi:hypothetical protein